MRRIDRFYRFHDARPRRGEMLIRRVAFNRPTYIAKNFVALVNALPVQPRLLDLRGTLPAAVRQLLSPELRA